MVLFPPLLSHFWQTLLKEFLVFCSLCFQGVKLASQPKEELPWVALPHTFAQTFGLPFHSGSQNAWPMPRALASCLNPRSHSAFCLCWGTHLVQVVWLASCRLNSGGSPERKRMWPVTLGTTRDPSCGTAGCGTPRVRALEEEPKLPCAQAVKW